MDQYVYRDIFNYCDMDTKLILVCLNKTFRKNNMCIQKNRLLNQRMNLYSGDISHRAFKYSLKPLNWKQIFLRVCDIKDTNIVELIKFILNYGKYVYEQLKVSHPQKAERYWINKPIFKAGIYRLSRYFHDYGDNNGVADSSTPDSTHDTEVKLIKDFMKENNIIE